MIDLYSPKFESCKNKNQIDLNIQNISLAFRFCFKVNKYFIFEYPDDDEWGPPVPKMKITLETKEEVQALFDALAELRKQQNG